jgi:SMC interacting uncharacterized protein involved in chromosome segregation
MQSRGSIDLTFRMDQKEAERQKLQRQLDQATSRVERLRTVVTRQKMLVEVRHAAGHDATQAKALLDRFFDDLRFFVKTAHNAASELEHFERVNPPAE